MARLYGERKSPVPMLIGLMLLVLAGVGGYYMYQNRGADRVTVAPGEVNVVDNAAGNMVSSGDVDAERNGNSVTIGNGVENANEAASSGNAAPGSATAEATDNTGNAATGDTSVSSDADDNAASGSGNGVNGTSGAMSNSETSSTEQGAERERSKTITDNQAGTTVTYKKKVSGDGSVTQEKTQSGAAPSATSTGP